MKNRDSGSLNHAIYDSSRGANKLLYPTTNSEELSVTSGVSKFLKGGYAVGDAATSNNNGDSFVAWNWVANGGTEVANTDGSGSALSCTTQANQTAGFSIVRWSGNGGQTQVAHGLSSTPEIVWQKRLDDTSDWWVYTTALDNSYDYTKLNANNAWSNYSQTAPSAKTFTSHGWGSYPMVAYCWHSVRGYSKIGSYLGNANADGPFVYTGFKPTFILFKSNNTAYWHLSDRTRQIHNPNFKVLYPGLSNAEGDNSSADLDYLSNGFKIRQGNNLNLNYSGVLTLYMAFAEHPFAGTSSINPATAH